MVSVKYSLQFFSGILGFGLCFGKYFTLVPANTDKRSSSAPIGLQATETVLHCAALCDLLPSCYSFTFSKSNSTDNCRLLSSTATSSAFTASDPGSRHYQREVDCGKCSINYTMAMDSSYDCQLQQETPRPGGWVQGTAHGECDRSAEDAYSSMAPDPTVAFVEANIPVSVQQQCIHVVLYSDTHSSFLVLNGIDQEFVATSSGCNTIQVFQCLQFYWYSTGPAMLKVTAGSGSHLTTYFSQTVPEGHTVSYELKHIDIAASHSSLIRFVGFKTKNSGGGQFPLGIYLIKMVDCPCSCIK